VFKLSSNDIISESSFRYFVLQVQMNGITYYICNIVAQKMYNIISVQLPSKFLWWLKTTQVHWSYTLITYVYFQKPYSKTCSLYFIFINIWPILLWCYNHHIHQQMNTIRIYIYIHFKNSYMFQRRSTIFKISQIKNSISTNTSVWDIHCPVLLLLLLLLLLLPFNENSN
jgi:hypothetical protein